MKKFSNRRNIEFTLLSDPQSKIIKAFNLLNDGYAHPMVLVMNENGIVKSRFSKTHYSDRPTVDSVMKALRTQK